MKVLLTKSFLKKLSSQIRFILTSNPENAYRFKEALLNKLKSLADHPYKCRKSIYFDDHSIRDLIFKGYVIVYKINAEKIEVFGFVKYQDLL